MSTGTHICDDGGPSGVTHFGNCVPFPKWVGTRTSECDEAWRKVELCHLRMLTKGNSKAN